MRDQKQANERDAQNNGDEQEPLEVPSGAAGNFSDEVGSEGGTPGDVELTSIPEPAGGSEATELVERRERRPDEVRRDDTGVGRRSPIG